jgi:hypothetical protein
MKRILFASLAALVLWGGVGQNFARAQFNTLGQAPPRVRPTVSPFINLGQGGGAASYYGIVRPQVDANRSIMDLQQNMQRLNPDGTLRGQAEQQGTSALGGLQTGHATTFFNTGQYYPMSPGSVGGNPTLGSGAGIGGVNGLGASPTSSGIGGYGVRAFFGGALAQPLIR